jgi:hypothetical protein
VVYIGCLKLKQHINEKPVSVLGVKYRVRGMVLNATQQYFSHIVAVSFIRGGNQSTQRKPLKNVIRLILKLRVILWLGIMIMCLGEMTCLHTDYCFSELVQNIQLNVGLLQSGVIRKNSHHISKENSHLVVSNNRDSLI